MLVDVAEPGDVIPALATAAGGHAFRLMVVLTSVSASLYPSISMKALAGERMMGTLGTHLPTRSPHALVRHHHTTSGRRSTLPGSAGGSPAGGIAAMSFGWNRPDCPWPAGRRRSQGASLLDRRFYDRG